MEEKKTVINSSEAPSGAVEMSSVDIKIVGESGELLKSFAGKVNVLLQQNLVGQSCAVSFRDAAGKEVHTVTVKEARHIYQSGSSCVFLRVSQGSTVVQFSSRTDTEQFVEYLYSILSPSIKSLKGKESVFSLRTDNASASQYFMFYSYLSQQQNMLQDSVRTSTYQSAMLQNIADFKDKVVLDVGAGSGILSFFAVQAGARKVYAVEASTMALHCMELVTSNRLSDKVTVLPGKIEEIDVPEKVDVIVSEPMGYMLYNERMLETYLHAKKWLKTDGLMYPTKGMLYCAPFSDELLFMEQYNKANFWTQPHFYGINLASLNKKAVEEYFRQPIVAPLIHPSFSLSLRILSYGILLVPNVYIISAYAIVVLIAGSNIYSALTGRHSADASGWWFVLLLAIKFVYSLTPILVAMGVSNFVTVLKFLGAILLIYNFWIPILLQLTSQRLCYKTFKQALQSSYNLQESPVINNGAQESSRLISDLSSGKPSDLYMTPYSNTVISHWSVVAVMGVLTVFMLIFTIVSMFY